MEIKKIPEKSKKPLKRAAAYTRVSVFSDETEKSLEHQISYYAELINRDPELVFYKIYADEGVSGTREDRPEFMQMLKDARDHQYDILFTKSVTRLARNTVTLINTVRELKELGIDIFFEKENIHSMSEEGELLLTMLAMYAEEEARSASENVKWSYEKRFLRGEGVMKEMYGYRVRDGKYEAVPEEAEVVQQIYEDYLNGASVYGITRDLNKSGITRADGRRWNTMAIDTILKNEKYTGNMLLQKTYRPDYLTKRSIRNKGQWRQYYVKDTHEPIIPLPIFQQVQAEREKRAKKRPERKYKVSPDNLFYGKVVCSSCGLHYKRYALKNPAYKKKPWYTCHSAKDFREKCEGHIIKEETLVDKTKEVLGMSPEDTLTREIIEEKVAQILCTPDFLLVYELKNGKTKTIGWRDYFYGTPTRRNACREHCKRLQAEGKLNGRKEDKEVSACQQ